MRKRMVNLLLAAGMLLSLTACAGGGESVAPPAAKEENKPEVEAPSNVTEDGVVERNGMKLGTGLAMEEDPVAEMDENPDRDIDRAVEPIEPVPDTMLDGRALTDEFYFYRETLDPTLKQAYDLIRAALLEGKKEIKMTVPVPADKIFDVYKMVLYDSPELFWVDISGVLYYKNNKNIVTKLLPGYNDLAKDIEGNSAKLEAAVSEALADIWSLPTDAEKAKYAHDYLTHHISYEFNADYNQNCYSALVNGESVCAGYSHAFQYLMQQVGIPCAYVLGYVPEGYHAWNVVKLDGEHYAMDVTWDDPLGVEPGKYYYDYFNLTDQQISADHSRADASTVIPAATGTACSFQNAFGGSAYGTDFAGIVGVLPEKVSGGETDSTEENPYLS